MVFFRGALDLEQFGSIVSPPPEEDGLETETEEEKWRLLKPPPPLVVVVSNPLFSSSAFGAPKRGLKSAVSVLPRPRLPPPVLLIPWPLLYSAQLGYCHTGTAFTQ